jgi:hypothetical protein
MAEPLNRKGKGQDQVNDWDYEIPGPKSRLANGTGGGIVMMTMLFLGLSGPEPWRNFWSGAQGDRGMAFFQGIQMALALMRQR